jgi:hypothetical protein
MGNASVQALAGWRYQRLKGSLGTEAVPVNWGSASSGSEKLVRIIERAIRRRQIFILLSNIIVMDAKEYLAVG